MLQLKIGHSKKKKKIKKDKKAAGLSSLRGGKWNTMVYLIEIYCNILPLVEIMLI